MNKDLSQTPSPRAAAGTEVPPCTGSSGSISAMQDTCSETVKLSHIVPMPQDNILKCPKLLANKAPEFLMKFSIC